MELDPDCLRDVLLTVERHATYTRWVHPEDFSNDGVGPKFGFDKMMYHVRQAELSGFFTKVRYYSQYDVRIQDLSPAGHDFLANIRKDSNWSKTKEVAKSVGSKSVTLLTSIAAQVIADLVEKNLHLNQ